MVIGELLISGKSQQLPQEHRCFQIVKFHHGAHRGVVDFGTKNGKSSSPRGAPHLEMFRNVWESGNVWKLCTVRVLVTR